MNNKYPQIHIVYDRQKRASMTKPSSLEVRITHNYKQKYISTGIMLFPNQWKKGRIVNHPDILQLSKALDSLLSDIRQIISEMLTQGNLDISLIPERLEKLHAPRLSFLEYCAQRVAVRKFGKKQDTQERYDRFLKSFEAWGGIREFEEINEKTIIAYDAYLATKGLQVNSKWNNYHRFLNSFIIDAMNDGHLSKNPYKWINIEKGKKSKGLERCLAPEEFFRMKAYPMPTDSIERVRDVFVFQTYTCLSYSDLKDFDSTMIQEVKGMQVYVGKRIKTGGAFTIPLVTPALDILHKYEGKLPIISNVKYNEYLKVVAQAARVDKPVSSHWARHTGATMLLNEGVDMKIVAKICGHSSTKITEQVYAKLLDETVVDAISELKGI